MRFNEMTIPSFGVAGNFTGHLEQAGEAVDFKNIKTAEVNAPKALFPTYLPVKEKTGTTPDFLHIFPFSSNKIIFPKGEEKIQIEPECAILCEMIWDENKISQIIPKKFAASNDCSIRKEGAKKISQKKNWGECSKGLSENQINIDSFSAQGILNGYRIASFLIRDGKIFDYGEDSAVRDYSYIYEKLEGWILDKLNNQKDEGPAENIHDYLIESCRPTEVMISIGATRYTDFGEHNFLQCGDRAVVVVYPEKKYDHTTISSMVMNGNYSDPEISVLDQVIEV